MLPSLVLAQDTVFVSLLCHHLKFHPSGESFERELRRRWGNHENTQQGGSPWNDPNIVWRHEDNYIVLGCSQLLHVGKIIFQNASCVQDTTWWPHHCQFILFLLSEASHVLNRFNEVPGNDEMTGSTLTYDSMSFSFLTTFCKTAVERL